MKKGFTLIELLVVVLIIGVLSAIALPMYNKAVLRSRFAALMPIVKSMNDSNEAYYLEHGSYASNPQDLPVQGQLEYSTGTTLEFGPNSDYAYVLASNSDARNNYIMYQKQSENYPGEIHCEAVEGDELAESVCVSAGGTQNIGQTITEGYVTYILSGTGAGIPAWMDAACVPAQQLGFTCSLTENSQGQQVKKICMMVGGSYYCRTRTYNEDGSYTSLTCQADTDKVCISTASVAKYDANGNKIATRGCTIVAADDTCSKYSAIGMDYTYDANGNRIYDKYCNGVNAYSGVCGNYSSFGSNNYVRKYDENGNLISSKLCSVNSSGDCTSWATTNEYTYDANGRVLTNRVCTSGMTASGDCTSYNSGYNYTYDANGNILSERKCSSVDSSGNCTEYNYNGSYDYTYDANGNMLTKRNCAFDGSGNCTSYIAGNSYDYTYDTNGNMLTSSQCGNINSSGNCTGYIGTYTYTYDANGNQLSQRRCQGVNCSSYASWGNYNYTYDANGNMLTKRECSGVDSSGNCTSYTGTSYVYTYDENGKQIAEQKCSGSNLNTATGECTAYNSTSINDD